MTQIILKLGRGNFQDGFNLIQFQIFKNTHSNPSKQITASLPSNKKLSNSYGFWRKYYDKICENSRKINFNPQKDLPEASKDDSINRAIILKNRLNSWLNSEQFISTKLALYNCIDDINSEIRFIIETEEPELRTFPWHLWDFFDNFNNLEIALSPLNFEQKTVKPRHDKVRMLAIFGHNQQIDLEQDKLALKALPDTEIVFLEEPNLKELQNKLEDKKGWDILFYAGHSWTDNTNNQANKGYLAINRDENIDIFDLKEFLEISIANGLKLAIFNSCDGLGIARQLESLNIPHLIVMRYEVPDLIAQKFLKYFLKNFSKGDTLFSAVNKAKKELKNLEENDYPCATWLPVICQNIHQKSLLWQDLHQIKLKKISTISFIITLLIMGLRWFGAFQGLELKAFDYFMHLKPPQPPDSQILIVGADESDISVDRYNYPLPDKVLLELLQKVQAYQPKAIAIDIFRDQPVSSGNIEYYQKLTKYIAENQNIIVPCSISDNINQSVAPPSNIPTEQIAYVDLFDDSSLTWSKDDTIRRYVLTRTANTSDPASRCHSNYSLAWHLIHRVLTNQGLKVETEGDNWKFGSVIFERLKNHSGAYHTLDDRGSQILINYRNTPKIAQQLTVRDILDKSSSFNPNFIKNKVILIGVTADSVQDVHDTPLGEIRGIYIHAHVVSHILQAVETEGKNLIWWFPQWGDFIFVSFWGITGGLIVGKLDDKPYQKTAIVLTFVVLYAGCWWGFSQGIWLPFIPANIALITTIIAIETSKDQNHVLNSLKKNFQKRIKT